MEPLSRAIAGDHEDFCFAPPPLGEGELIFCRVQCGSPHVFLQPATLSVKDADSSMETDSKSFSMYLLYHQT